MESHESTRNRLETILPKNREDRLAGKKFNSWSHYNLVYKIISTPQAIKKSRCQSRGGQREEKLEKKKSSMATDQKRSKRHRKSQEQFILLRWKTSVISQIRSWNPTSRSKEIVLCSERHCERRFWFLCSICRAKFVERYCGLANKTIEHQHKVSTPCFGDRQIKRKNWDGWRVLEILLSNRFEMHELVDQTFSGLKTNGHEQWQNGREHVTNSIGTGSFQDPYFLGDFAFSESTSGGTMCIFGSRTFVPISWMCKEQTSTSHRSTECQIISFGTSLRIVGIPALDLWDLLLK